MLDTKSSLISLIKYMQGIPETRRNGIIALLNNPNTVIPNDTTAKMKVYQFVVITCIFFPGVLNKDNLLNNKRLLNIFTEEMENRRPRAGK